MKIPLDRILKFDKLPAALRNNPKLTFVILSSLCIVLVFLVFGVQGGHALVYDQGLQRTRP